MVLAVAVSTISINNKTTDQKTLIQETRRERYQSTTTNQLPSSDRDYSIPRREAAGDNQSTNTTKTGLVLNRDTPSAPVPKKQAIVPPSKSQPTSAAKKDPAKVVAAAIALRSRDSEQQQDDHAQDEIRNKNGGFTNAGGGIEVSRFKGPGAGSSDSAKESVAAAGSSNENVGGLSTPLSNTGTLGDREVPGSTKNSKRPAMDSKKRILLTIFLLVIAACLAAFVMMAKKTLLPRLFRSRVRSRRAGGRGSSSSLSSSSSSPSTLPPPPSETVPTNTVVSITDPRENVATITVNRTPAASIVDPYSVRVPAVGEIRPRAEVTGDQDAIDAIHPSQRAIDDRVQYEQARLQEQRIREEQQNQYQMRLRARQEAQAAELLAAQQYQQQQQQQQQQQNIALQVQHVIEMNRQQKAQALQDSQGLPHALNSVTEPRNYPVTAASIPQGDRLSGTPRQVENETAMGRRNDSDNNNSDSGRNDQRNTPQKQPIVPNGTIRDHRHNDNDNINTDSDDNGYEDAGNRSHAHAHKNILSTESEPNATRNATPNQTVTRLVLSKKPDGNIPRVMITGGRDSVPPSPSTFRNFSVLQV